MNELPLGPPPPGLKVKLDRGGFGCWVYPDATLFDPILWVKMAAGAGGVVAVLWGAAAVSLLPADLIAPWILGSAALFIALVVAIGHLLRFRPVEVGVDGDRLIWDGDRIARSAIASCRVEGRRVVVRGHDREELVAIDRVPPEAAAWLAGTIHHLLVEPG